MQGREELLMAQIEQALHGLFPGAEVQLLLYSAGVWRHWSSRGDVSEVFDQAVPVDMQDWAYPQLVTEGRFYLPLKPGAVGVLIRHSFAQVQSNEALGVLQQYALMAMSTCERQYQARLGLDEVKAVEHAAERILKSHDLNEILLHITQEAKHLLSADICGVLLCEGDDVVMRHCVGNVSAKTAMLRMAPGQGLAGLVLATRRPSSVDDYVSSGIISRDFFQLAETEAVRSALAVPLLGREQTIGVLEVWRRRPSIFTQQDKDRLVALANLVCIAIENAELYAYQRRSVEELARANAALNERYDTVAGLSDLTQNLMQLLLGGGGLAAIVAQASSYLGADVLILDLEGRVQAHAGQGHMEDVIPATLRKALTDLRGSVDGQTLTWNGACWHVQPILSGSETIAWILAESGHCPEDLAALALAQVAIVGALYRQEQRAASRARSESIDAIVWDLLRLEGPTRLAAIDRAGDVHLDLEGELRLFIAEFGPSVAGGAELLQSALRRQVLDAMTDVNLRDVRAIALRGLSLVVLCGNAALDTIERQAVQLARRLREKLAGRAVQIGVSSTCPSAHELHVAFREAQVALDVARQLRHCGAVVYDRAGMLGMLLGLRHEADMRRFVTLHLGGLLTEDEKSSEQLLQTLRVFFDVNCSHEAAAHHLGVHRKTVANRVAKIAQLTGLDFSTHDDRLVADISLYVHRMLMGDGGTDAPSTNTP